MNDPLALLLSDRGLIVTQLSQRLEALRYRWVKISNPAELVASAESLHPMIVFADAEGQSMGVLSEIEKLRNSSATSHIPVIAFAREVDDSKQAALVLKGASVAVSEAAMLSYLPQLLDRALEI